MHRKCGERLVETKGLSLETRSSCPMCRAPFEAYGSKEQVERLQRWVLRGAAQKQQQLDSQLD